jgi:hypothetical protein
LSNISRKIDPGKFLFVAGPVEPEHRRGDAVLPAVLPAAGGGPEGRQGHAALRPEVLQGQPGFGLLACGCGVRGGFNLFEGIYNYQFGRNMVRFGFAYYWDFVAMVLERFFLIIEFFI